MMRRRHERFGQRVQRDRAAGAERDGASQRPAVGREIDEFTDPDQQIGDQQIGPAGTRMQSRLRQLDSLAHGIGIRGLALLVCRRQRGSFRPDPGAQPRHDIGKAVGHSRPGGLQGGHPVRDGRQHGQEHQHAQPQGLQRAPGIARGRRVVIEVSRQGIDLGGVAGQADQIFLCGVIGPGTGQRVKREAGAVAQPAIDSSRHDPPDGPRQNQIGDKARADDPQGDLLDARHGDIEDGTRVRHGRKADQGRRIAAQHEHIGSRRAVEQRQVEAEARPARQRQNQEFRGIHQVGDQGHGRDGADQGAEHAKGAIWSGSPPTGGWSRCRRSPSPSRGGASTWQSRDRGPAWRPRRS